MNLKTILLLVCLFSAIVLTYQATADEVQVEAGSGDAEKESLLDSAKRIQEKSLGELKSQAKRAKEEFKAAYKKLKNTFGSDSSDSSDSSSSSEAPAEASNEQGGVIDEAERKIHEKAIELLTSQAQKAKQQFKAALKRLKKGSDSSDSSDSESEAEGEAAQEALKEEGGVVDKAKEFAKRKSIEELQEQALKAKEELRAYWNKWRGKSADAGSSGDNNAGESAESAKEDGGLIDKAEEKIKRRSIEELKEFAIKAKGEFKTALKNRLKGNKSDDTDSSSSSSGSSSSDSSSSESESSGLLDRVRRTAQGAWDSVSNKFGSQEKVDAEL